MSWTDRILRTKERRAAGLVAILVAQTLCALFFITDVVSDLLESGPVHPLYLIAESLATVVLAAGIVFFLLELRKLYSRIKSMAAGLSLARGELAQLMTAFFDEWRLTASERDVALLMIKGLDNEAIAGMRGTAAGTVRAQSSSIFRKAGVDGRVHLLSLLMDELLELEAGGGGSVPDRPAHVAPVNPPA